VGDAPRPLGRLGTAVAGLLALVILADLAALAVDLVQLDLLTDIRDGRRVGLQELRDSDDRVAATGLLQMGAYFACTVAFLVWYGRAYRNLERLGLRGLRFGKRWAIAYWFIPIANLFRPKQVMNDIWRGSDPDLPARAHHWQHGHVPALLHWWWGLWLLSSSVSNALFRRSLDSAQTPDDAVSIATSYVVIDVVDIVPAILAILVVRRITARQEERRSRYERGEFQHPAAPEDPRAPDELAPAPA
jgi:hypothetical protein